MGNASVSNSFRNLRLALRCLTHPISLTAILLLLFNDHWLKYAYPSVLTGKISDFSGIFFFPFLIIASLNFVLMQFPTLEIRTARLSFVLTGVIFGSIQLFPPLSYSLEPALSNILHAPVSITPDPTDLIAISALLPAWQLWKSQNKCNIKSNPVWQLSVYFMALTATLATSCMPILDVDQVIVNDGKVYLESYDYMEGGPSIPVSEDHGQTWIFVAIDELPASITKQLEKLPQLPKKACNPLKHLECFRITGGTRVEHTTDSGQTWNTVWRFPVWRMGYLKRLGSGPCGVGEIHTSPKDLALLTDETGKMTVFVAMGNQGLLIRTPEGSWEQADVPGTRPLPFRAKDFSAA